MSLPGMPASVRFLEKLSFFPIVYSSQLALHLIHRMEYYDGREFERCISS